MNNPFEKIWGFHIHQELSDDAFPKALVIQERCSDYLRSKNIQIDAEEAFYPGYGPHLNFMWELRVESGSDLVLENLGLAISYMAVNRFGMSGYIHPLMHNRESEDDLASEGRLNQANILWFGNRVDQVQDFFFNPSRDRDLKLVDTRTPKIMSTSEKLPLLEKGKTQLTETKFRLPEQVILKGFHIHMDYLLPEENQALVVFDEFIKFLLEMGIRPTSTRLYDKLENGPHVQAGWEVKFELFGHQVLKQIGIAVGWLMCNRHGLPVFLHPVTWRPADFNEEYLAHSQYGMFMGSLPELDLSFFLNQD